MADVVHADFKHRADWLAEQIGMDRTLTLSDVRTAAYIAARLNGRTMECFPGQATIAAALGLSEVSIGKSVRRLEERGHIAVQRSPQGSHRSNRYRLRLVTPTGVRVMGCPHPNPDDGLTPTRDAFSPQAGLGLNTSSELLKENTRPLGRFSWMDEGTWVRVVRHWQASGEWSETYGPSPEDPGCELPKDVADRMGVALVMTEVEP